MKPHFIFCHGWGLDPDFWRFLKPYFPEEDAFYCDLGYFGENEPSPALRERVARSAGRGIQYIGIGHSLGLIKLLSLNIPFQCLIGLQSFIHFLGFNPELHEKRQQELAALTKHFTRSPIPTLKTFCKRCGLPAASDEKLEQINQDNLSHDLELLSHPFDRPQVPLYIIGSQDDVIVPPELIRDNFENHALIEFLDTGKHGLGYHHAEIISKKIMGFISAYGGIYP